MVSQGMVSYHQHKSVKTYVSKHVIDVSDSTLENSVSIFSDLVSSVYRFSYRRSQISRSVAGGTAILLHVWYLQLDISNNRMPINFSVPERPGVDCLSIFVT